MTNSFKIWLESENIKDVVLGYLGLDKTNGYSQPLSGIDKGFLTKKITGLGLFRQLPADKKQNIITSINIGSLGTVGDLIKLIA